MHSFIHQACIEPNYVPDTRATKDDHHKTNIVNFLHTEVTSQQELNLISSMKLFQTTSPTWSTVNVFIINARPLNLLHSPFSDLFLIDMLLTKG